MATKKRIRKSDKYKYVYLYELIDKKKPVEKWFAMTGNLHFDFKSSFHDTEREAALAVDRKLIELNKEPVNILKRL